MVSLRFFVGVRRRRRRGKEGGRRGRERRRRGLRKEDRADLFFFDLCRDKLMRR